METRAHYILIGSFALAVMASAFLFVLWLGRIEREFDFYDIAFTESVAGLSVASIVRYQGIEVGDVRDLQLDPEDPSRVIASIRLRAGTPVREDTVAQLELQGLTGLLFIQLSGGSPDAPLLRPRLGQPVPQIQAAPSEVEQFLSTLTAVLSEENVRRINGTIANIEAITGTFASRDEEIGDLISNVSAASEDIQTLSKALAEASVKIDTLLGEEGPRTLQEVNDTAAALQELTSEMRVLVSENRSAVQGFTNQGLPQTVQAIAEARRLMSSMEALIDSIERDPARFLQGGHYPEYEGSGG
ncbi:MAG: MlaD family protein [Pseudomonadota bacterium]